MSSDPKDIRNWLRLSERITTSGALANADPQRLAGIGVERVINLALDDHEDALPEARALMAAAGLEYVHIPVSFDAPSQADYHAFVTVLEADEAPVHVHCIMNYRVSAFFYRWNRGCGMPEAEARRLIEATWSPHEIDHPTVKPWRDFVREVDK